MLHAHICTMRQRMPMVKESNMQTAKEAHCKRTERVEDVPSGGGTLGQVAGNVDGDSMLAGCEAADFALDSGGSVGGGLGQAEDTGHAGFAGDLARCRGGHGVVDVGRGDGGEETWADTSELSQLGCCRWCRTTARRDKFVKRHTETSWLPFTGLITLCTPKKISRGYCCFASGAWVPWGILMAGLIIKLEAC